MTTLREAAMRQALEALAIGQDAACEVAQTYHEAMAGYRPARHIAVDDDVRKIEDAITALRAALAEPQIDPVDEYRKGFIAGQIDMRDREQAEPVQEPVECEPQYANKDGWCDWVCPIPQGYLMQCCDCGLIHEVDSRVVKYEPRPSEAFVVVGDPDFQVQWRMKRRDDISPKQPVQEPVAWMDIDSDGQRLSVRQWSDGNSDEVPLYAAPPQRKPLTEEEILKAVGWDRAEMYMKLTPNFPVAEAKEETLKNARAIERAHGIGGGNE